MGWQDYIPQESGAEKIGKVVNKVGDRVARTLTTKEGFLQALNNAVDQFTPPSDPNQLAEWGLNFTPAAAGMIVGKSAKGFSKMIPFSNLADKQPRARISDKTSRLADNPEPSGVGAEGPIYRVQDVYEHPALFEQYPDLKNVQVDFMPGAGGGFAIIRSTGKPVIEIGAEASNEDIRESLLHEMQHWIQSKEGFAKGSTLDAHALDVTADPHWQQTVESYRNFLRKGYINKSEYDTVIKSATRIAKARAYRRAPGEIEARDTTATSGLDDAELLSTQPYASQGIPVSEWGPVRYHADLVSPPQPKPTVTLVTTRAPDFKSTGNYDVSDGISTKKIYRNPDNGWWYEAKPQVNAWDEGFWGFLRKK